MEPIYKVMILMILLKMGFSTSLFLKTLKRTQYLITTRNILEKMPPNTNTLDPIKYKKSTSFPPLIVYIFGRDPFENEYDPTTAALFQRDLDQRYINHIDTPKFDQISNNFKYSYMNALTTDKLNIYEKHIDKFLINLTADINKDKLIISSYKNHMITFWMDVHLHNVNKQDKQIITDFCIQIITIVSIGEKNTEEADYNSYLMKFIQARHSYFKANKIFKHNIEIIKKQIDNNDTSAENTISYNWMNQDKYLLPEQVITAGLHNIVAFSQLINIFYIILEDKNNNNWLEKYENAPESEKYSIIKEIFRLEVPTTFSISGDDQGNQKIHIHQSIMYNADTDYATFKPNMYEVHTFNKGNELITSKIDKETILEDKNKTNIPVFKEAKYCPFGFGYRRCAGENFVYFFMYKLLNTISKYNIIETTNREIINIGVLKQGHNKFKLKKK